MPTIKADGVAEVTYYRSWWIIDKDKDAYKWSIHLFLSERDAIRYGKRVAARFNRIFGEAKDE